MVDMSKTIEPKSDQLNADDLIAGPKTITITGVTGSETPEQPVSVAFDGDGGKPYKPCKSMRRVMVHCWGADATQYKGRSMTLYCDPDVTFGGMKVGGIRIGHMSHIDGTHHLMLTASKAKRKPFVVKPLDTPKAAPAIDYSDEARAVADKGSEAFRDWWTNNPDKRASAKSIMDELKQRADKADEAKAPAPQVADDDDELPM